MGQEREPERSLMRGNARDEEVPPHAPEESIARRLLGRFHVTGVFWFKIHQFGVAKLPPWGLYVIISVFTTFFFFFLFKIRRAIGNNLEAVLGPCGWWRRQIRIYRTMWDFAWCSSERYERLSTKRVFTAAVEGEETWHELLAGEKGFILVTAHVGHWEIGSMLASSLQQNRLVHVVREKEMDPRAQKFIEQMISDSGEERYQVHFARDDDLSLGTTLLTALRRGELVALQGDRPRAHGRSVTAKLFDRPFTLPAGPAALARAAEVVIVPVFVLREGRKSSRVVIRPPIEVAHSKNRDEDIEKALCTLTADIEWAIRQYPHQWFCFRQVW